MDRSALRPLAGAAVATVTLLAGALAPAHGAEDATDPYFEAQITGIEIPGWTEYIGWWAADDDSGVNHVDARLKVRVTGEGWSRWRYPDAWQNLKARDGVSKHYRRHHSYRIQIRATDNAGNRSPWTDAGGGSRP